MDRSFCYDTVAAAQWPSRSALFLATNRDATSDPRGTQARAGAVVAAVAAAAELEPLLWQAGAGAGRDPRAVTGISAAQTLFVGDRLGTTSSWAPTRHAHRLVLTGISTEDDLREATAAARGRCPTMCSAICASCQHSLTAGQHLLVARGAAGFSRRAIGWAPRGALLTRL